MTPSEAATLLTYVVFTYWQPTNVMSQMTRNWYDVNRQKLACSLPGYMFGVVWAILFGLISATGFIYLGQTDSANSTLFISAFVVFSANVILTKIWYPLFFGKTNQRMGLALFVAMLINLSGVTFLIFMGLDRQWVGVGLYSPYVVWSAYAVYLNYRFFTLKTPKTPDRSQTTNSLVESTVVTRSRKPKKQRHAVPRSSHAARDRPTRTKKPQIVL